MASIKLELAVGQVVGYVDSIGSSALYCRIAGWSPIVQARINRLLVSCLLNMGSEVSTMVKVMYNSHFQLPDSLEIPMLTLQSVTC